jgi:hypothetical protein
MTPVCSFCGTEAPEAELLLQCGQNPRVFICSWCVESALPAIAAYRRSHGWKRVPPPPRSNT